MHALSETLEIHDRRACETVYSLFKPVNVVCIMAENVMRAHLVLKPPVGASGTASGIPTAATIKSFMASPETVREAVEVAEQLGFKVISTNPLQVTIEGPKGLFEKVFSSRLKSASPVRRDARAAKQERSIRETPASLKLYTWDKTPKLPAELKNTATEIALPQATALHG